MLTQLRVINVELIGATKSETEQLLHKADMIVWPMTCLLARPSVKGPMSHPTSQSGYPPRLRRHSNKWHKGLAVLVFSVCAPWFK